ncbi:MAG: hypothetical protein GX814_05590 [Microbacteriaceae bacterium]|nr:hypothetical protein [Microbacteriaceae bacterium]
MNRILKVTRLQMNKRDVSFFVPAIIVGMVMIVTAIISIALQRAGVNEVGSPEYVAGAMANTGIIFSLPGFLVYYGVQAVSTTFPFATALGATRRNYVIGTALANAVTGLYVAAMLSVLLFIELATTHWFMGIYVLDTYALGSGNVWQLALTSFLGTFAFTSIGGVFAAVWVRFGSKGPPALGLALGLVLAVLILVFVPYFAEIFAAITGAMLAWIGLGISVLAIGGTWFSMRRTAVR